MGRVAIVVNASLRGTVDEALLSSLRQSVDPGDLFITGSTAESAAAAKILVERAYSTVLVGGGDGTFSRVVTDVVSAAKEAGQALPRFGVLRMGTGNSLADVLGGQRRDPLSTQVSRVRQGSRSRSLRLVQVEGTLSPFCGLGIDADVLADFHWMRGVLRTLPGSRSTGGIVSYALAALAMTMPKYLVKTMPRVRVVNLGAEAYLVGPGDRRTAIAKGQTLFEGKARMASASTIPNYGFGFRVFPFAGEREDRMALRITSIGPFEFLANARALWRGEYRSPATLFDCLVERARIEVFPAAAFQIGGDAVGARTQIEIALSAPIEVVDFNLAES